MTRLLRGIALVLVLLAPAPLWGQEASPPPAAEPEAEEPERDPWRVEADAHFRITVDAAALDIVREGSPFPLIVTVEAIDKKLEGTLIVSLPAHPELRVPIALDAPATREIVLTPTWNGTAPAATPSAFQNAPDLMVSFVSPFGFPRYREGFYPVPLGAEQLVLAEGATEGLLLPALLSGRGVESPVNGVDWVAVQNAVAMFGQGYYGGGPTGTSRALDAEPASVLSLPPGGYPAAEAYAPIDVVILHGADPRRWSNARIAAFQDWVLSGGIAILWPSQLHDWDPLFPIGLGDSSGSLPAGSRLPGSIEALADFVAVPMADPLTLERGPLGPGFSPLLRASDGAPLLGVRHFGRGYLLQATCDLAAPELRGWTGLEELLTWMISWGRLHAISERATPGATAATLLDTSGMSSMMGYGMGTAPAQGDARLALPLLHPAAPQEGFRSSTMLLTLVTVYVLLVLFVFPLLRRSGRWRQLLLVWAASLLLCTLYVPVVFTQDLVREHATLWVDSPDVPAQGIRGELLVARRGFGSERTPLTFVEHPRLLPPTGATSRFVPSNALFVQQVPYTNATDFALVQGPAIELDDLRLQVWNRRLFYDHAPPSDAPPALTATALEPDAEGTAPRLEVAWDHDVIDPDALWVLERHGQELFSGLVLDPRGSKTIIRLAPASGQHAPYQGWGNYRDGELPNPLQRGEWYGEPLGKEFGRVAWQRPEAQSAQFWEQMRAQLLRSQLEAYAAPVAEWVTYQGGRAVVALEFPEGPLPEAVKARVFYDAQALPSRTARAGRTRLGHIVGDGVDLAPQGVLLGMGEALDFVTDQAPTHGEQIILRVPNEEWTDALVLDQFLPGIGWRQCPQQSQLRTASAVFARYDRRSMLGAEALFRIRARGPVTLTGIEIIAGTELPNETLNAQDSEESSSAEPPSQPSPPSD